MSTQADWVIILTFVYLISSWIGAILFTFIAWQYHRDRMALIINGSQDRRLTRLRRSAAWRNEYIGVVMAVAFWLYAITASIVVIRIFGLIHLPWERGLGTTLCLVFGNFIEMTIAIALTFARRQMNARRDGEA